ncbi:MAG: hypothetical protein KAS77_12180 [Thermoplasmata archaeon]|nr:hypothetical protein [Thermoplasmata archaeon]
MGGPLPWEIAHHGVVGNIEESKPRLYLAEKVVDDMGRRSREGAIRRREDMGLLLGDWAMDAEDDPYAVAMDLLTGSLEASPVAVKFKLEGLMKVAHDLDDLEYPYVIVGWYHTHLDLGCFLSDKDIKTQVGGFPHPHQVAVIVDPMRKEAAAFANGPGRPGSIWAVMESYTEWEGVERQE